MNTANFIARYLKSQGCRLVFGMPGGASLPVLEALRSEGIDFILVRQEASAGFMADGVFQRTGTLSACIATLGPGVSNLVSGIAQAYLERSRILGIVSQIDQKLYPLYTHQIIDQKALFAPISHGYFQVQPYRIGEQIRKMARCLSTHLGPVIVELSKETALTTCSDIQFDAPTRAGIPDLSETEQMLKRANFPVIFIGAENLSPDCASALHHYATSNHIPVLTTYRAKGLFPEKEELSIGTCGLSPVVDRHQQDFLQQADCLICIGLDPVELRPNWLPGWPDTLPVINISEQGQPDLLCAFQHDLRGNIVDILRGLSTTGLQSQWSPQTLVQHKQTIDRIFQGDQHNPATVIKTLQQQLPKETVLCLDVGAHRITASHVWKVEAPRMILQSNGFSSMGVAIPYGIACALLEPEAPILVLTGDMGLAMSLGELGIIQERDLNIIIVYLADRSLSLIELKQERDQLPNFGVRFENPDPIALAQAFGGKGWSCQGATELENLLEEQNLLQGFHLIEVQIDPQAYREQI